ncbi:HAMP domain-containing histidine kinase [Paenibacillus sp. CC-CFT747]|nr:HAMP domain-containing histidine kinase [Paenibacillus sp. CC-CFT747]
MSIRTRLTLWYSGVLGVTLLVFGIVLYGFLYFQLFANQRSVMEDLVRQVNSQLSDSTFTINGETIVQIPQLSDFRSVGYFIQITTAGELYSKNFPSQQISREMRVRIAKNKPYVEFVYQGVPFYLYTQKTQLTDKYGQPVFLQIGVLVDDIRNLLRAVSYFLIAFSLLVILIAATLGWYLSRKALRPIEQVTEAAAQIQKGVDLNRRIGYEGPPDEIGRLTNTVNEMLSRIQGAYEELEETNRTQRRFVSDASHELRTPLTTIRGNVDLLEKMWKRTGGDSGFTEEEKKEMSLEAMQDIAGEAARMSRLVNDLLALARADAGVEMSKQVVELRPLVEEVIRKAGLLPKTVEWRTGNLSPLEGAFVNGSPDHLQQMLFIFIENAFKYTIEGYVLIDAIRTSEQIGIRISDTGMGMDSREIPHIFDRFYRADVSRGQTSGTGLGLSIAKWIIDEHRGSIEVTTREGEGSTFVVWLPLCFPPTLE